MLGHTAYIMAFTLPPFLQFSATFDFLQSALCFLSLVSFTQLLPCLTTLFARYKTVLRTPPQNIFPLNSFEKLFNIVAQRARTQILYKKKKHNNMEDWNNWVREMLRYVLILNDIHYVTTRDLQYF